MEIVQNNVKSQEAYFGINNPLVSRLESNISLMRSKIFSIVEDKPLIKYSDIVKLIESETKELSQIIEEEMNIEKCTIGYTSKNTFYNIGAIFNKNIYKNESEYKKLKNSFDEIIESKNGYRFKNKNGVYVNLVFSLNVLKNDIFSDKEIVAIILHELGHATVQIVHGLDIYILKHYMLKILDGSVKIKIEPGENEKEIKQEILDELSNVIDKNNDETYETARSLLKNTNVDDKLSKSIIIDFKNLDTKSVSKYVEVNKGSHLDSPSYVIYKKKDSIFDKIFKSIGGFFFTFFIPFLIPSILKYNKKIKETNENANMISTEESIADNFAFAYGLGPELQSAQKKLQKRITYDSSGNITKIPMLDTLSSYSELVEDFADAAAGYPSDPKRVANNYIACKYELDNNKELSASQKAEILKQMDELKAIYDEYVYASGKKGLLYKLFQKTCKKSIEEAAANDADFKRNVLDPLKERSNKLYK